MRSSLFSLLLAIVILLGIGAYKEINKPEKEDEVTTTPLVIDIPDNTKYCNLTVYNSDGEVIFSYLGDVTFGRGHGDNDPMKLTVEMPDAGIE